MAIEILIVDDNSDIRNILNELLIDNGIGFSKENFNLKEILNPYFTTKKNGTGLGLAIVNKIINDHNGVLTFIPIIDGAKVEIKFLKNGNRNFNS